MAAPSNKSRFRRIRLVLLGAVGGLLLLLIEPHVLCFGIKYGLMHRAAARGRHLEIGAVEGSIFEPLVFRDVEFTSSRAGVTSQFSIVRAEAHFAWMALITHSGKGFFDRLIMDGIVANMTLEPESARSTTTAASSSVVPGPTLEERRTQSTPSLPLPTRTEVWNANFAVRPSRSGDEAIQLSNIHFTVSEMEPGEISVGKVVIRQNWLQKSFTGLKGTTAIQGKSLAVADLKLEPGVWIKKISTDLDDASRGRLRADFDLAAFNGAIRGQWLNASHEKQSDFEVTGTVWQISVADLARFLQVRETTGGTIKEGKFSFRGSLQALDKASVSTWFEATDFVWGKRQWNSLILGATVVDGRVQIPQLELQQAHNALTLKGEMAIPTEGSAWWESEFNFDIAGRINNLTELSALFGSRFADTSGVATIDGSIRGTNKVFSGQLIVAGKNLSYRHAPIDLLNAGIKLDGNEAQIINLELVHGDDFVRGKGTVSIFGERQYSGELKASINDLADYAPLLQKPIAPAPLVGGLSVEWSGDGTLRAHSGAFTAHFRKLCTTGSPEIPATLPIDADLEGTYAPGGFSLSKCILANGDTKVDGRVAADKTALKIDGVKLTQKAVLWLEGSAILPVNVFQWWVAPGPAALMPDAPFKVQATAHGVQLDDVAHLTGRPVPVSGILSGSFNTDGSLHDLKMTGAITLTKGRIPENPWFPALDGVEATAELDGNILRFSKFSAHHPIGDFTCSGAVDFSKFDSPALDLAVHGEKIEFSAGPAWSGKADLDVTVAGTREHANVNGTVQIVALDTCPVPDFGPLISSGSSETIDVVAPALALSPPLNGWHYDLNASTGAPIKLPAPTERSLGQVEADLHIVGTGATITVSGNIDFTDLPVKTEFATGNVEAASFFFASGKGNAPDSLSASSSTIVVARVAGRISDTSFIGYFAGPVRNPSSTFVSLPEMSATDLHTLLAQGYVPLPPGAGEINVDLGPLETPAISAEAPPSTVETSGTTAPSTSPTPAAATTTGTSGAESTPPTQPPPPPPANITTTATSTAPAPP